MALWGQGDPRWIVEERPDSKNVNNWHWTERDATTWSKVKLKSLFLKVCDENEDGNWKINEVKKIDGEATINNRKGKLIYFYEWNVELGYEGQLAGSELNHSGTIKIPNLSDENDANEVDVEITCKGDTKNAGRLRTLVKNCGVALLRSVCAQYIQDMRTEFSSGMVLPTKSNINANTVKPAENCNNKMNQGISDLRVTDSNSKISKKVFQHVSLDLKEEFRTSAEELYITLTDAQRLTAFTRSPCVSRSTTGGEFSIMGGNITGYYVELDPYKKIVEKWRFKEWPKDVYSVVTMEIEQKSDLTLLKLKQTGVPDYDTVKTEEGWKRHFWGPIKQVFGFGAQLF